MAARLALHVAALRGDAGKVRNLLLFGAAVNQRNDAGCTPLHSACFRGAGDPECVKLLLRAGADVDAVSGNGLTALAMACILGHGDCVRLLLLAGADSRVRMDAHNLESISDWAARQDAQQELAISRTMHKRRISHAQAQQYFRRLSIQQGSPHLAAWMVRRRNVQWSPSDHCVFPQAGRVRAVQVLLLVAHLPILPLDVWVQAIIPHAMGRAIEWCDDEPRRAVRISSGWDCTGRKYTHI